MLEERISNQRLEMVANGLVTINEATKITGLKKTKLYNLMATGELPYCKIGGARRIPRKALFNLMARHLIIRENKFPEGLDT